MLKKDIILIGGGGHCNACIDVIENTDSYNIAGIIDKEERVGETILNYKIIGSDIDILKYIKDGYCFIVTIGQIKSAEARRRTYELLRKNNGSIETIFSKTSYISKFAEIGAGTIAMHHVVINSSARVGENCLLNTGCNIEHDAIVGNHVHVASHAVIGGNSSVGSNVFIGSNATISSQVSVTDNVVIGAGTVVNKDITVSGTYVGNPARLIATS